MTNSSSDLSYLEWNNRIVGEFFNTNHRGRSVHLSIDSEMLLEIGGQKDDLVLAVLEEAESSKCRTILKLGKYLLKQWQHDVEKWEEEDSLEKHLKTAIPPFVAVLSVFVLAVNHLGERFIAHAYYKRLHALLGDPSQRISSLKESESLWVELEKWSLVQNRGRLGVFRVESIGGHDWIGIPRRQILIAKREIPALVGAFIEANFAPESDPTDRQLHNAVRNAEGLLARSKLLL